ncbi:MAG TPA: glycosyltransferase family 4 protein [Actinomycetota bacterium]|nr:glycosyltransferase family 4 protein [Actinomycetota bacterium]
MKVGIVCPYDWSYPGGVRSHILGLAEALPSVTGGSITAEILAPASKPEPGIWAAGRTVGIPANGSVARLCFGPGPARRVAERVRRGDLDLLHLHEPGSPSISLLALRAAQVPAVATFHASAEKSAGYAVARPLLGRVLDRLSVRIAVSAAARSLVGRYFPAPYRLIPNGVPVARFAGAFPDSELAGLKPFVLFVGRAEPRKGFGVLLAAVERLRGSGVDVRMVTTGNPEGVPQWVVQLGRVEDDRLPGIYAAADVYCAPSLGGESFGIVLVEAMAAGTPVVCSDLPGYREAAGAAARFVPRDDPVLLAAALGELLANPPAAAALVEAGRKRAAELDWRVLASEIAGCYRQATES